MVSRSQRMHSKTWALCVSEGGVNHRSRSEEPQCSQRRPGRDEARARRTDAVRVLMEGFILDKGLEPAYVPVAQRARVLGYGCMTNVRPRQGVPRSPTGRGRNALHVGFERPGDRMLERRLRGSGSKEPRLAQRKLTTSSDQPTSTQRRSARPRVARPIPPALLLAACSACPR